MNILGREITHKLGLLACFFLPDGGPCLPNKSKLNVGKLDFSIGIGKLQPAAASPWAHFKRVSFRRGKPGTAAGKLKVLLDKKRVKK